VVLKFFLHVSKEEQKRRFLERLDRPEKHWKFSSSDLAERAFWADHRDAYEDGAANALPQQQTRFR
jgi:polyphosphate kinase 2 (PPK2 family)